MRKRQKRKFLGIGLVLLLCGIAACGPTGGEEVGAPTPEMTAIVTPEPTQAISKLPDATVIPEATATPVPTEASTATPMPTHTPAKNEGIVIPAEYRMMKKDAAGTVEEITYKTKDYYGNGEEVIKPAYVYLPAGYDTEKQYNVLFVMHGGGGDQTEFGIQYTLSSLRLALDNLIYYGDIEPLIVVFPNGRTGVNYAKGSQDHTAFKDFGLELRNDLIPYIDANYATYGAYDPDGYDLTEARDHRAMAGFSFGGMQTVNIGLCECLDIMSYFGSFAAGNTTYNAEEIAACLESFKPYEINYIYSICGNLDGCLYLARDAFAELPNLTDKVVTGENMMLQVVPGSHSITVAQLGLYNFVQLIFK